MEATIDFIKKIVDNLNGFGFPFLVFFLGVLEFSFGLYKGKWPKNERWVDIACFTLPRLVVQPAVAYYSLHFLPYLLPQFKDIFSWVPFLWGFIIIAVADDLTQYWYHRLHPPGAMVMAFSPHPSLGIVYGDGYGQQAECNLYHFLFADLFNGRVGLPGFRHPGNCCKDHQINHYYAGAFQHPMG